MAVHGIQLRDAVQHPPGDGHARRPGSHQHELVATGARDRVHHADALREHGRHLAQDVVPGPGPGRGVQLAEAVDVEQGDGDLRALPLRARDLQLQDPRHGPRVREARQRIRERDTLEPLGPLVGHGRGAERRDGGGREIGDPDQQDPFLRAHRVLAGPAEGQHAHAGLDVPAARDDERQVRTGHRGAIRGLPDAAQGTGSVQGGVVDRVLGIGDDLGLESLDRVVRDPQGEQQLQAVAVGILREDGGHRRAGRRGPGFHDDRERRVQVLGTRERGRATRQHAERAAAGTDVRVRHGSLRVTTGPPRPPIGRPGICARPTSHATPHPPPRACLSVGRVTGAGRGLCSAA